MAHWQRRQPLCINQPKSLGNRGEAGALLNPIIEAMTCWTNSEAQGRSIEEIFPLFDDAWLDSALNESGLDASLLELEALLV